MRRVVRKAVVAAIVVAAASGCGFLGSRLFQQPTVELRDVRVAGLGFSGGNLDVVLAVYNPNGYRLDATQMHYQLMVDTIPVASGEITNRNAFQGGDTTIVHLPVTFSYAGLGAAGRELSQTGAVIYRVTGDLTVDTPIGTHSFPFKSSGRFTTINAKLP